MQDIDYDEELFRPAAEKALDEHLKDADGEAGTEEFQDGFIAGYLACANGGPG
jgi:hypothetical protein